MKRKTLIVVISSLLCLQLYGQHVLKVSLGDVAPYDSLKCHITGAGMKLPAYIGQYEQESQKWFFNLPDSVYERYESMSF